MEENSAATQPRSMGLDIKVVAQVAVTVGLAAVLNMFPLYKLPQGGSVSLDMVPIIFLALRRGAPAGILAGGLYGLIDLFFDPYIVHPAQLILDYPLAFALVGLAGLVGRGGPVRTGAAVFVGGLGRFTAHFLSGVIFFAAYAPKGQSPWLYSAIYNGSYMSLSTLAAIPIVIALLKAFDRVGTD